MGKLLATLLLTLVIVACGSDGNSFKIDGRLLNLNQGEFYVYSPDGVIEGVDTIFVVAGRFNYKTPCEGSGTLVIVFPNFSEQPVFAQAGKSVKLSGDVSHLRELKVTGTKDNKLMNAFRAETKDASEEETKEIAKRFVQEHANSVVAIYLVNKYFIRAASPDYPTALSLFETIMEAQPKNGLLAQSVNRLRNRANTAMGCSLPKFEAVTVSGDTMTERSLTKGDAVVYLWASYEYGGCEVQRTLARQTEGVDMLGVCVDEWMKDCRKVLDRDKIETAVVCDTMGFASPLVELLSFSTMPDNLILENGKIVARGLTAQEIKERYAKKKK